MTIATKALVVLFCAATIACGPKLNSGKPEPGLDVYSVLPDSVTEFLVSSPTHKLYAYRWAANGQFHLVFASKSAGAAEQCSAGAQFDQLLRALTTVTVVKESERRFEVGTASWADVRLRDTTSLEPIEARMRIPEASGEPVVLQFQDRQYVVKVDPTVDRKSVV